jgi:puromycin-sensitive aminopeptidase
VRDEQVRLSNVIRPLRYDLTLDVDLEMSTFRGSVTARIEIDEETPELVLHALELEIGEVFVDGAAAPWALDVDLERLVVRPTEVLSPGTATLTVTFQGVLNDLLRGFYRSTYVDTEGATRTIATTQMQATDCRRVFPCWDEPEFKAVFGVTLVVDDGLVAISNGAESARVRTADGRLRITFADTMPMSTYLVAFVVGPLETTEAIDVDGVPVRIVHVPGQRHRTDFGLETAAFALRWFTEYYGIPYPGDKIDLVALPDFAAGAMENLGCITFRENLLLVDPRSSTQQERQLVVDVVAHELAHMWFGDLVTMRWWNGIWLNEAFATFMEVAACDAFRPMWERWTTFGVERTAAFETDVLASTRAVEYEVRTPEDSEGMFDVLTYKKGGALLRMLEQYLGTDAFRRGVSHYLDLHRFGSTETSDLWDAIEAVTGAPVRKMMDGWIWQPGFPVVAASAQGPSITISQSRAMAPVDETPSGAGASHATPERWHVPVHVRRLRDPGASEDVVVLEPTAGAETLVDDDGSPVVVNSRGVGYFRVVYDDALRDRFDSATIASMSALERYCLIDDAWFAVTAGLLDAPAVLNMLERFSGERDPSVWTAVSTVLRSSSRLVDREHQSGIASLTRHLAQPALGVLGWDIRDGDDDLTRRLRGQLIQLLGTVGGDREVIARCDDITDQVLTDSGDIDPEITSAAITVTATHGGQHRFEQFRIAHESAESPQDRLRFLYALSEADDAGLVGEACDYALSGAVRSQNAPFLLGRCIANRWHGDVAWERVRRAWAPANERFPLNSIIRMVDPVKLLTDDDVVEETRKFFQVHPIPQSELTLRQVLERQRVNQATRRRESARLAAWLEQKYGVDS